ncbi:MAG: hypothetical protein ACREQD_10545, partial [Candidatus Binataceae bacterium]
MAGKLGKLLALLLLLTPLFGCSPALDSSSEQAGLSITSDRVASPSASVAQSPQPAGPAAGQDAVASLPFVRSRPETVPPFPIVLNRTVQNYVDGYVNQPASLKQSLRRLSPYVAEMDSVLR